MSLPKELTQAIENARDAMLRYPQHDIGAGYRHTIWAALGPRADSPQETKSIGLKRRATLAILSTQHVLPLWERARPGDTTPQHILAEAERALNKAVDKQKVWKDRNRYWVQFNDLINENEKNDVIASVGFAAVQALTAALQDERFDPDRIDIHLTDFDIDVEELDASFFAAAAYAHGPIWAPQSSAAKRREFWEWWLKDAVPSVWNAIS